MLRILRLACAPSLLLAATPASALCIYNGVDNARTTIGREFADSHWVVRARVLAATSGEVEEDSPDAGMGWTRYRLQVVRAYKGRPPERISFFTMRNSGGFYLDRPWLPLPAAHDIGSEYLLFLAPVPPRGQPAAARGAVFVNYNCGQSRPWAEVPARSRRLLASLSGQR